MVIFLLISLWIAYIILCRYYYGVISCVIYVRSGSWELRKFQCQTYFSEHSETSHFPSRMFQVWNAFRYIVPLGGWNFPTSQLLMNTPLDTDPECMLRSVTVHDQGVPRNSRTREIKTFRDAWAWETRGTGPTHGISLVRGSTAIVPAMTKTTLAIMRGRKMQIRSNVLSCWVSQKWTVLSWVERKVLKGLLWQLRVSNMAKDKIHPKSEQIFP